MVFSCRKNAFFQASIKLTQPFPAPELRTENFTDTRIFLTLNIFSPLKGGPGTLLSWLVTETVPVSGSSSVISNNRPPIDDRNPIRKLSIDPLYLQTNGTTRPQLTRHDRESKRRADTEIQYRPGIVDTDIDWGPGTPFLRTPFPRLL